MRCRKMEKWISDATDGRPSADKLDILKAHLRECSACRSYRERLEKLQRHAEAGRHPGRPPEYWRESLVRLKTALEAGEGAGRENQPRRATSLFPKRRWAWTGAAALFVAGCGFYVFLSREPSPQEMVAFSFEDALTRIDQDIGTSPELEKEFSSTIQDSIYEHLGETNEVVNPFHYENPLFLESLNEEDLQLLDAALRTELKL